MIWKSKLQLSDYTLFMVKLAMHTALQTFAMQI